MNSPKTSNLLICIAGLLLLALPAVAQPTATAESATAPAQIEGGSPALLDQTVACDTFGSTSQFFPDFNGGSQLADDFVVPAGLQWTIDSVTALGFYDADTAGQATTANVEVFADDAGLPGASVCSYPNEPIDAGSVDGNFVIDLGTPCVLGEGTYWLQIQAVLPFNGTDQWFLFNSFANNGEGKAFQDTQDLFGTGCTTWMPADDCLTPNAMGADDNCILIAGTEGTAAGPFEIPTLGQYGLGALLLGLIAAGLVALRRRG